MNLQINQTITLDFSIPKLNSIRCVENDRNSRTIKIFFTNNNAPFPLDRETMTACYKIHKPDHTCIYNEIPIDRDGTVTICLTDQASAKPGIARCELQILTKDRQSVLSTLPFSIIVEKSVVTDKDITSSGESNVLLGMMQHMADRQNPHQITKKTVGLENADNTSDLDKPISHAARRELDMLTNELASCLKSAGGSITGNLILPTQNTMIYGENNTSVHNHALLIGHNGQDYWNFYEYGGIFNFYRSQDNHDTLLGRITENGWEGDASRSDALQSFRSDRTPYPRGEYVIRSIYGNDQKFWLQCLNDNSDQNRYQVAVDWAGNSHGSDQSQYLQTFNAAGESHGDTWLLKCQHNLYGDGNFGLCCGNGSIGIKVDCANKDGAGRIFEENYARAIRKFYVFHVVGWHRIAKFEYQENTHVALGNMASGCEITIKRAYNLTNNQYHHLELAVVYRKSKWKEIVSLANTLAITKIRHVCSGATAYIDVYYNTTISNNTTITLTGPVGSDHMANWEFLANAPIVSETDYTTKFSELILSSNA